MFNRLTKYLLALCVVCAATLAYPKTEEFDDTVAGELYKQARMKCLEQKWLQAVDLFEELLRKHPDSRYQDDARFWMGYSLEKAGGKELAAFQVYNELINNMPHSSWSDDAQIHQIGIAERLALQGENSYGEFIADKLQAELGSVRRQATLALGRLGDSRALPYLQKLTEDPDLGATAEELIQTLQAGGQADDVRPVDSDRLRLSREKKSDKPKKAEDRDYLIAKSRHYEHYRSMLRTDDNWSQRELLDFGMWHIMSTDAFTEYRSLQGYDQEEWLRKFWKKQDPTPTTELNEKFEEFKRRVNYARAHFSDFWSFGRLKNMKDEHLVADWPHAPWDARGELYIKYGEPDFQNFVDLYTEEWNYFSLGVDFIVKKYRTNIYGNAISSGPISDFVHRDERYYVDSYFIYQPEFRYHFEFKGKKIKDAKVRVTPDSQTESTLTFKYEIPAEELKIVKISDTYRINYLRRYVVLNEDMDEVIRDEIRQELRDNSEKLLKNRKLHEDIALALKPGEYMVALRIEDLNSDRFGIYVEKVRVSSDGPSE